MKIYWILTAAAFPLIGCAVDPGPAFQPVAASTFDRTHADVRWNRSSEDERGLRAAVSALMARPLTPDAAVQVALLSNPALQATFEDVGIAEADVVQAGLLHNPQFAASWRFPDRAPRQTDAEYAVSDNFLELLILPLRKKIAAAELQRTQSLVADAVLSLAGQVKKACYTLQSQQQLLEELQSIQEASDSAAELAGRQHAAGTINDLELATQRSVAGESALELMKARLEVTAARESLARLLGLEDDTTLRVEPHLAELPAADEPLAGLEAFALDHRLDLAASRQSAALAARSLGLTEDFRYFATLNVGIDTEHNPDGSDVTGPTLDLELPLFDQGQARVATLESEYRRARRRLEQQVIDVRSEVRLAHARMTAERQLVMLCDSTLLPERAAILSSTLLHYDAMLKGPYDLLMARQNEIAAQRAELEARCDYWIARADLERAVGGRLPPVSAPQSATRPAIGDSR